MQEEMGTEHRRRVGPVGTVGQALCKTSRVYESIKDRVLKVENLGRRRSEAFLTLPWPERHAYG